MRTKKTETKTTEIPSIDTSKLNNVTGGCAACGNPNHVKKPAAEG